MESCVATLRVVLRNEETNLHNSRSIVGRAISLAWLMNV